MQRRARKIKNEAFPVGDPRRWEPGLGSIKRRDRKPLVTENERIDEYVKHRPHYLAIGRWIRSGKPDESFTRPLNSKQRREATRTVRLKAHDRRNAIADSRFAGGRGKSARRRAQRNRGY